jgi:MoaA/NifB/PqqE/SkfB family radical SAM enzyme
LQKTLLGIKNALACNFNVNINTTINALNYKQLPEFVEIMSLVFMNINHFVFNFLDPGMSDGNIKSRASENPAVVAKYADIISPLKKMVGILKKRGKTFRIERVPLCCMSGFEEYSTETRKIVKEELYICSFVEKNNKNRIRIVKPGLLRTKVAACKKCSLDSICAGVQPEYLEIHGESGLKAVEKNINRIIKKIKKSD